jgi:hypothetical protein
MSWTITLNVPLRHGVTTEEWEWIGLTYNLGPMLKEGGINLDEFDGKTAMECSEKLEHCWTQMKKEPDRFKAHNPPNLWGDFAGCERFVGEFLAKCEKWPQGIVLVT